jgi:glycosyltransferase 2 family protein
MLNEAKAEKSKLSTYLQYGIFLAAGLLLVWWQLHGMTDKEIADFKYALFHAKYILVIPVVIMNLSSHLVRSMRWKLLMEPLGFKPSLQNTFAVTMVGYLANSAVPRLGEVLKCTLLSKYENLKTDKLIGTIVIERVFDLICYFIFICITVIIQIDVISSYVKEKLAELGNINVFPLWAKIFLSLILILIILYFVFKKKIVVSPLNRVLLKIKDFVAGILSGIKSVRNLKKRKLFLLYTLFIWAMYLLQLYVAFSALDSTAHLGIKAACSVLSLSTLAMIVTPGGLGSFPIFVSQTLAIYAIEKSQGEAYGWLIWGVSTIMIIVVGVIAAVLLPYINKNKNENQPSITT